jgi:hypothetical protein
MGSEAGPNRRGAFDAPMREQFAYLVRDDNLNLRFNEYDAFGLGPTPQTELRHSFI